MAGIITSTLYIVQVCNYFYKVWVLQWPYACDSTIFIQTDLDHLCYIVNGGSHTGWGATNRIQYHYLYLRIYYFRVGSGLVAFVNFTEVQCFCMLGLPKMCSRTSWYMFLEYWGRYRYAAWWFYTTIILRKPKMLCYTKVVKFPFHSGRVCNVKSQTPSFGELPLISSRTHTCI